MLNTVPSLAVIALLLTIASSAVNAQEIEATVAVNDSQLSPTLRDEVAGFADDLKRYVDEMRWTEYKWDGDKVKMNFNVVFTGYEGGSLKAKLLVGSQRSIGESQGSSPMMKLLDENWTFAYTRNQPFQRNFNRYDEMTGLIDFYAYIAIGLDLDSYEIVRGALMHAKAREIAQRAQTHSSGGPWSTQVQSGVFSRIGLVKELNDIRYTPIRQFIFNYHYNGLDLLAKDRTVALDSVNKFLTDLVVAKNKLVEGSTLLRVLTDAKHVELSELFAGYTDETVWRKLTYIDPSHTTIYEAARTRR